MKRWICLVAIFSTMVGAWIAPTGRGQVPANQPNGVNPGDIGPGAGGATLRLPGTEAPSPAPSGVMPEYMKNFAATRVSPFAAEMPARDRIAQLPSNQVDINKEFEITERHGPWAILVMSYSGPEAPQLAHEFVIEMRKTFKLNACVFNYGAEEKRKEYERVQKLKQESEAALKTIPGKSQIMPPRIRAVRIDEHTGVLIANNYKTRDEALAALQKLRKLKLEQIDKDFAKHVKLDAVVAIQVQQDQQAKSGMRVGAAEIVLQNPFSRAFPVRNPAISEEQAAAAEPVDMKLLQALNAKEPLSLLQVKKPFTLVIKQFNTQQVVVRSKTEQEKFFADQTTKGLTWERQTTRGSDFADRAGGYAHSLAEAFRRSGLPETYVLHTKYCSFVTVGGYESLQDPRLLQWQNHLESQFRSDARYQPIGLLERPAPMAVPH